MKKVIIPGLLLGLTVMIYFAVATRYTFHPMWALDYFNELAAALREGHLDLRNPSSTYDLILFGGKWYAPWGILAALFFLPIQAIKGRFIPAIYISILFASLNVLLVYFLLVRLREEFLKAMRYGEVLLVTALYAFGTMNFYVGTLGSAWHVDQMVSSFFGTLSVYLIFKHKRRLTDYLYSVVALVPVLLGHATFVLLVVIPGLLYVWDIFRNRKITVRLRLIKKGLIIFGLPLGVGTGLFLLYNYLRFGSPWEYGYSYILEAPFLEQIRLKNGVMSLTNLAHNIWYFAAEIPSLSVVNGLHLGINILGNSLFFLTPPLLTIFLAVPWKKIRDKWTFDPYVFSLWTGAVITIIPSLMIYSTGWMQFGYRYGLDIMPELVLLSVFGVKGKLNTLYILGISLAIFFHVLGIQALM